MAPDDSTGPGVCNDADNYFWYNWQPFSNPQPEMFIPLPTEAITNAPLNTIASQNCRSGNIGAYNGWFLPFPLAAASSHEEDPAASVSAHNYFLHCSGDWHPLSYFGEGLSEPPSEVPQLEDFFSARRASPPPSAETKTAAACYYGEEQRVKPGKSSSEDDSKSDRLSQSMPSFDGDSDANLARALPLPPVAFPPPGDVTEDGKSRSMALVGTTGQRSSSYRGVTRHRWTGRYEAHLWDNTCVREGVKRKGRQVYLGGYDREEKAARAYDLAALKYWGPTAATNFPVENYAPEIEEMKDVTRQEFVASLRRKSTGFSRGASVYRGVTRHHQHGRWQARIGRVAGNKDLYLGTFTTEEEAAEAYDIAAIKFRGVNAITNFELSRYNIEAIACTELPIGSSAKRLKFSPPTGNQDLKPELAVTAAAPDDGTAASFLHSLYQARPGSAAAMPATPQLCWGSAQIE